MKQFLKGLLLFPLLISFSLPLYSCNNCTGACTSCQMPCCTPCDSCSTGCCDDICYDCKCCLGPCEGSPFLLPRSQSVNAAREIVGVQPYINKYDMEKTYGAASLAVEYTRTFDQNRISQFFFGGDLLKGNSLLIQGSDVANRDSRAWLADYFGLPADYKSEVSFRPVIENFIADFNFYLWMDKWYKKSYLKINLPLVHTRWNLRACEKIIDEGEADFAAGYMAPAAISRSELPECFLNALNGFTRWGDMRNPIRFGKISPCKLTKTALADIQLVFGYNFWMEKDYHLGLNLQVSAPTGTRPSAFYLFEPIIGNGKHWELGVGISGSWIFCRSEEREDFYAGFWLEANMTHLFKACQCRSFDFFCKPNSRYMLLEEMGENLDDIRKATLDGVTPDFDNATLANYQYQQNLIPAINWSTFNVKVKIPFQADLAVKLGVVRGNWSCDLGYNFWGRTGEKFCTVKDCSCNEECSCCNLCPEKSYAIKGDSFIYAYSTRTDDGYVGISATQSCADIHSGLNSPSVDGDNPISNPRIDNPNIIANPYDEQSGDELVYFGDDDKRNELYSEPDDTLPLARSSFQPNLVSRCDLNMCQGPGAISHKFFMHTNYSWDDYRENWTPFFGFGGEIEFSHKTHKLFDECGCNGCCTPCASTCELGFNNVYGPGKPINSCCGPCLSCCNPSCCKKRGAISQWGLWVKGGIAFQ